jgi:putative transposase
MPRAPRIDIGGVIYHVLNRAVAARRLFETANDYQSFERVLTETQARTPVRLFSYCVMPTHWHLVLAPETDGGLSAFMAWLTMTHTQRWHTHHKSVGTGHLYQGRFKSFPVQADEHFITVCRYVERNPLRAGLVQRAEDWLWGSLWQREQEGARSPIGKASGPRPVPTLSPWPVPRPANWLEFVNEPQSETEVSRIRKCVARGTPRGETAWAAEICGRFNGRGQEP